MKVIQKKVHKYPGRLKIYKALFGKGWIMMSWLESGLLWSLLLVWKLMFDFKGQTWLTEVGYLEAVLHTQTSHSTAISKNNIFSMFLYAFHDF